MNKNYIQLLFLFSILLTNAANANSGCYTEEFLTEAHKLYQDRKQDALVEHINNIHRFKDKPCVTGSDDMFIVKKGRYIRWTNNGASHWFIVPGIYQTFEDSCQGEAFYSQAGDGVFNRIRKHVAQLSKIHQYAFPVKDYRYDLSYITHIISCGDKKIRRGYPIGSGLVSGDIGQYFEESDKLKVFLGDLKKTLDTIENRIEKDKGFDNMEERLKDIRSNQSDLQRITAEYKSQSEGSEQSTNSQAPNQEPNQTDNNESSTSESDDSAGGSKTSTDGDGSTPLPSGAPPWLTDVFRMLLKSYNVEELGVVGAMALYMVAPDLVEQMASMSSELTKGLSSPALDDIMSKANMVMQYYAAASSLASGFAQDTAAEDTIKAVAKSINQLPPAVRAKLEKQIGGDLAGITKVATIGASLNVSNIESLYSDDVQNQIKVRLKEEAKNKAVEALANTLNNVFPGDFQLDSDVYLDLANGNYEKAGKKAAMKKFSKAADRLGVSMEDIEDLMSGDTDRMNQVAEQQIKKEIGKVLDINSLPTPDKLNDAFNAVKNIDVTSEVIIDNLLPSETKRILDEVEEAANNPKSYALAKLQEQGINQHVVRDVLNDKVNVIDYANQKVQLILERELKSINELTEEETKKIEDVYKLEKNTAKHLLNLKESTLQLKIYDLTESYLAAELNELNERYGLKATVKRLELPDELVMLIIESISLESAVEQYLRNKKEQVIVRVDAIVIDPYDNDSIRQAFTGLNKQLGKPFSKYHVGQDEINAEIDKFEKDRTKIDAWIKYHYLTPLVLSTLPPEFMMSQPALEDLSLSMADQLVTKVRNSMVFTKGAASHISSLSGDDIAGEITTHFLEQKVDDKILTIDILKHAINHGAVDLQSSVLQATQIGTDAYKALDAIYNNAIKDIPKDKRLLRKAVADILQPLPTRTHEIIKQWADKQVLSHKKSLKQLFLEKGIPEALTVAAINSDYQSLLKLVKVMSAKRFVDKKSESAGSLMSNIQTDLSGNQYASALVKIIQTQMASIDVDYVKQVLKPMKRADAKAYVTSVFDIDPNWLEGVLKVENCFDDASQLTVKNCDEQSLGAMANAIFKKRFKLFVNVDPKVEIEALLDASSMSQSSKALLRAVLCVSDEETCIVDVPTQEHKETVINKIRHAKHDTLPIFLFDDASDVGIAKSLASHARTMQKRMATAVKGAGLNIKDGQSLFESIESGIEDVALKHMDKFEQLQEKKFDSPEKKLIFIRENLESSFPEAVITSDADEIILRQRRALLVLKQGEEVNRCIDEGLVIPDDNQDMESACLEYTQ